MTQTLTVPQLARAIHAEWRSARERDGWGLGPPDAGAKTSPYLKPIEAFSALEWRRERWLALTDLLAIAAYAPTRLTPLEIPAAGVARLRSTGVVAQIDAIAQRTHAAWATINGALGVADRRTALSFDQLDDDAKARSRANVACDIAAIGALTQSYAAAPLRIIVCSDMRADVAIKSAVLAAIASAPR